MRESLRTRLDQEYDRCKHKIKHPTDLWNRQPSDYEFVDTAIIGGTSIADVLAGKVHEWQVPGTVKAAFHLQYPNLHEDFVHAVQRLAGNPESLRGLISGVRGKLFEINYVDYLNHGHLPVGWTAHLAKSAVNQAWDVSIIDTHGHVENLLQLKASAALAAARQALLLHPSIDVVIPHDVLVHFGTHSDVASHLVDGHQTLLHLDQTVHHGVQHAELASATFHVPYISFLYIAGSMYNQYRNGQLSIEQAGTIAARRVFTSMVSSAATWATAAIFHKTIVGIPAGIWVSRKLGRYFKKRDSLKIIDQQIQIIGEATQQLMLRTVRRTLLLT